MKDETRFSIFKKECDKWLKLYGLHNWCVKYNTINDDTNSGLCQYDLINRIAVISLNIANSEKDVDPKLIAFHEVTELLFARIRYLATERYVQPEEINDALHECIRILENTLFKATPKSQ